MKKLLLAAISLCIITTVNAQDTKTFEGEIITSIFTNQSKALQSIAPSATETRRTTTLIKGSNILSIDQEAGMRTILLPEQNRIIFYSDVLKKGLEEAYDQYIERAASQLSKKEINMNGVISSVISNTFADTGEKKEYLGMTCSIYKGQVIRETGTNQTIIDLEGWIVSQYNLPESYNYFLQGAETNGLPLKWKIKMNGGRVHQIGEISSYTEFNIEKIIEREVAESEMATPSNYKIIVSPTLMQSANFYLEHEKAFKKTKKSQKEKASDKKKKNTIYKTDGEWNY